MKTCTICKKDKPESDYYKNKKLPGGLWHSCKECVKERVRNREAELRKDPDWVDGEKARSREKYHRLNYREKHRSSARKRKDVARRYNERYPEKYKAKNAAQRLDKKDGIELHHWSYNSKHYKDVIPLTKEDHMMLHRYMIYDQEQMMYRTLGGILMDTKEDHIRYFECVKHFDAEIHQARKTNETLYDKFLTSKPLVFTASELEVPICMVKKQESMTIRNKKAKEERLKNKQENTKTK